MEDALDNAVKGRGRAQAGGGEALTHDISRKGSPRWLVCRSLELMALGQVFERTIVLLDRRGNITRVNEGWPEIHLLIMAVILTSSNLSKEISKYVIIVTYEN